MESTNIVLKCNLTSTDSSLPIGVRIHLDNKVIYENSHVKDEIAEYEFSDADGEHELIFELFGKLPSHTKINDAGEILQDVLVFVKNLEIDGIDISQVLQTLALYKHDFNGTQAPVEDQFRGVMGCNGTVSLKFTTPLYLWLLENM